MRLSRRFAPDKPDFRAALESPSPKASMVTTRTTKRPSSTAAGPSTPTKRRRTKTESAPTSKSKAAGTAEPEDSEEAEDDNETTTSNWKRDPWPLSEREWAFDRVVPADWKRKFTKTEMTDSDEDGDVQVGEYLGEPLNKDAAPGNDPTKGCAQNRRKILEAAGVSPDEVEKAVTKLTADIKGFFWGNPMDCTWK